MGSAASRPRSTTHSPRANRVTTGVRTGARVTTARPPQPTSVPATLLHTGDASPSPRAAKCHICFTRVIDTVVDPCGHMCMCEQCATSIAHRAFTAQSKARCPLCRTEAVKFIRVFVSGDDDDDKTDVGVQTTPFKIKKPKHTWETPRRCFDDLAKTM